MKRQLLASIVGLALAGLFVPQAHAGAFAVTFTQAGSNVVAVASGSINLAGLSLFQSATSGYGDCASVEASAGSFDVGGSGPCDYTTPGLANACPSGEELDTFSSGIITFGTSTGPATSSLCANFTPADLYTGSINGPQTFGPGATGGSLTCVDSPTTISGSSGSSCSRGATVASPCSADAPQAGLSNVPPRCDCQARGQCGAVSVSVAICTPWAIQPAAVVFALDYALVGSGSYRPFGVLQPSGSHSPKPSIADLSMTSLRASCSGYLTAAVG